MKTLKRIGWYGPTTVVLLSAHVAGCPVSLFMAIGLTAIVLARRAGTLPRLRIQAHATPAQA